VTASESEVWKAVVGYEGIYEVSSLGRVKSLARVMTRKDLRTTHLPERVMKPAKNAHGYFNVGLVINGKKTFVMVHRLVAFAFLPPSELPHINHIDFNRGNNIPSNLQWVTPKQNTAHSIAAGRWKNLHSSERILATKNPRRATKLSAADVAEIRAMCTRGVQQHVIAKQFDVLQGTISKIKRNAIWSSHVRHQKTASPA
jgi:hypothetical protein